MADAGWYPDPHSPDRIRWWDGTAWTEYAEPANDDSMTPYEKAHRHLYHNLVRQLGSEQAADDYINNLASNYYAALKQETAAITKGCFGLAPRLASRSSRRRRRELENALYACGVDADHLGMLLIETGNVIPNDRAGMLYRMMDNK